MSTLDPEKEIEYRLIRARNQLAEGDHTVVLHERAGAHTAAVQEIIDEALSQDPEQDRDALRRAADTAFEYLYDSGNPEANKDDIRRHLKNHFEWMTLHEKTRPPEQRSWQPSTEQEFEQVVDLVVMGSLLGIEDQTPAYGPAQGESGGRRHEVLDDSDTQYNKFGFIVNSHPQPTQEQNTPPTPLEKPAASAERLMWHTDPHAKPEVRRSIEEMNQRLDDAEAALDKPEAK